MPSTARPRRRPLALAFALALAACTVTPGADDDVAWRVPQLGSGTLLVLNKSGDSVSLLDALSGAHLRDLPTGRAPHEVAVSPDGLTAVISDYGPAGAPGRTLTVLDLRAGRVSGTIDLGEHGRPHGLQFLRDGRLLAVTAEGSGQVLLVDVRAGQVLRGVATGQQVSHMLVLDREDRAWVANIGSGSVSVVDLRRGELLATIATGAGAEGIDITPDGREVWVGNREADTLTVLDTATRTVKAELPCAAFPIRVKITPDGRRALVSCAESGQVQVFDTATRRRIASIDLALTPVEATDGRLFADRFAGSPVPVGLLVDPTGERAWVASTNADIVTQLDLVRLQVACRLKAGREPDGLGWTPLQPGGL